MDTRSIWVQRAEAAIATLRGVEAVRILADGESIREIHVLSTSNRPAKQIVRDVQSVLVTRFSREIDYRVVSVAYCEPGSVTRSPALERTASSTPEPARSVPPPTTPPEPVARAATPPERVSRETGGQPALRVAPPLMAPARSPLPPPATAARAPAVTRTPVAADRPETGRDDRIRFVGVNLFVSGARTQAQVELRWKGLPRMGSASGWSTRAGAARMVASAAVAAVQEFLADEMALGVQDVRIVRLGRRRAVVVSLAMLGHRSEKWLTGSCVIEQDLQQAVVLATLSALNRLVGGLPARDPTEYVLRPTST
ncbi:MAG: hypothetical protein ACHQ52_00730 [Candidatus Eisenbacteria bacterium]